MSTVQSFVAKFPSIQAIEVAVVENGKPTDEHGFVHTGTGRIIDAETFLSLYAPAEPVTDSGRPAPAKRAPRVAKKSAASVKSVRAVRKPTVKAPTEPKSVAPPSGEKLTIANLIRASLSAGPKALDEIAEYVRTHGLEVEDRQVSNNLYQLRYTKKVERDDDGRYSLVEA